MQAPCSLAAPAAAVLLVAVPSSCRLLLPRLCCCFLLHVFSVVTRALTLTAVCICCCLDSVLHTRTATQQLC
jgi:hypothetical protein